MRDLGSGSQMATVPLARLIQSRSNFKCRGSWRRLQFALCGAAQAMPNDLYAYMVSQVRGESLLLVSQPFFRVLPSVRATERRAWRCKDQSAYALLKGWVSSAFLGASKGSSCVTD
jgi:hypothetical protein